MAATPQLRLALEREEEKRRAKKKCILFEFDLHLIYESSKAPIPK